MNIGTKKALFKILGLLTFTTEETSGSISWKRICWQNNKENLEVWDEVFVLVCGGMHICDFISGLQGKNKVADLTD